MNPNVAHATPVLATVLLVAAIALSGCTGSAKAATTARDAVTLKGAAFSPKDLTVPRGATVVWTNVDPIAHDVTAKGNAWQSAGGPGGMAKGAAFSRTFDAPGVYEYYCTLHSTGPGNGMSGTVTVT